MSDYGTMQNRVADELERTDLTTQIRKAIKTAIEKYERRRMYFNESIFALTFLPDRDTYSASDTVDIRDMLQIDSLRVDQNSSSRFTLTPRPWTYLEEISRNPDISGVPTDYAYRGRKLRVYPIPDATYTARVAAVVRFTEVSASADTNAWFTDAEELIRSRAKADLLANIIKNYDDAAVQNSVAKEALKELVDETTNRNAGDGTLQPSGF